MALPASALALAAALAACGDGQAPGAVRVDSATVRSADVAPLLDPARTYEYRFAAVRPDSALVALWRAGLPLSQAWLPLEYLCEDVRGPRLTVELHRPDARMADHDFELGTGRLRCSERLRRYRVRG